MRTKAAVFLLAGAVAVLIGGGRADASCTSSPVIQGFDPNARFVNCGPNPIVYAWTHGRGVQRVIASEGVGTASTIAGHDSGNKQTLTDGMVAAATDALGNPIPGSYVGLTDFSNTGWDGCIVAPNLTEQAAGCSGTGDFGPLDYMIGGVDPAQPNVGRVAVVSVDFNEPLQAHLLDNAGAPVADGLPCGNDAFSLNTTPIPCSPIPVPTINGVVPGSCTSAGCTIVVGVGDVSSLVSQSILDDCLIAEDKATNCPRNLYQGRVLVFKHGLCTQGAAAAFDRRAFVYPNSPPTGQLQVQANMIPLSREDADLNGVLGAGEDGSNGGTVNGRLDPIVVGGMNATTVNVPIPAVPLANDCIFIGMGILVDATGKFVDPPTNAIPNESVVSTVISLNNNPIRSGTGTPVSDMVADIIASKTGGKGKVDWTTGIEMTTLGFNVIGTKKGGGGEVKINGALIDPKEGTTGKGASYSVTFDASQLKGSSAVYIEVVKTNGSKERFGPASF